MTDDPERSQSLALDKLGWRQFQDLCVAVLELEAGVGAGAWAVEEDRGWHVRVETALPSAPPGPLPGPCHVQALWIADRPDQRRAHLLEAKLWDLRHRLEDWTGSVIVITNYADDLSDRPIPRRPRWALLGPEWLAQRIDDEPKLRLAMPSLLSLGDLQRWIPSDSRAPSTLDLEAAAALAQVFVPTAAYGRALSVLDAHRFTVLTGPPEMGKTSIARMIALALMTDGWEAYECTMPEQIFQAFAADRAQVFVADDAFGSTEYRPDAAERWAREMERLLRLMDDRHWLIWTSRPAPLRAGLDRVHRERGAERFPRPGEVLVDASRLSLDEKVLILLRHAKASVTQGVRARLRGVGYVIVSHPHFTPERIRRLVSLDLSLLAWGDAKDLEQMVQRQIRTPTDAMAASFNALSDEHQALLFALLDAPPGPVEERQIAHLARLHHPEGFSRAPMELVDRLTDHFLRVTDTLKVDWVHPSWRDVVIDRLRGHPAARAGFLACCTVDGLILAISTGGGPSGARSLALLLEDRDWDLATDQFVRVMRDGSDRDVVALLDALAGTVDHVSRFRPDDLNELRALAACALRAATRRCDRRAQPIELDLIGAWLRLAWRIPDQVGMPRCDRTWTELLPSDTIDLRLAGELDQAIAWLGLVELLGSHAPDQLCAYGFPEQHWQRVDVLISQARSLVAAPPPISNRDRLAQLLRLCRRHVTPEPSARDRVDRLIRAADSEPETYTPAVADYTEQSVRGHVDRILEDM
jgi:hypothetical protein